MARRGHGEGSIYQVTRPNGSKIWRGAITIPGGVGGRQVRRTVSSTTRREARDKLDALRREIDDGALPDQQITVEKWVRYYLDQVSRNRPTSTQTDANYAKQWIYPHLGHLRIRDLREDHIRAWHNLLAEYRSSRAPNGLAPNTIRRIHSGLQAALAAAVKERKLVRNVAAHVPPPAMDRGSHHDQLGPDEMRQVIDSCTDPRQRARLALAFAGLRQSEALALTWDHINDGMVSVRQTVHRVTGKGLVVEPLGKSVKAMRDVPLSPAFDALLEVWRAESGAVGWVFAGRNPANPEDPRRDYQAWADSLAAAGVRHVPLHGARGTTASLLKALPPRVAADYLGHSRLEMTTDVYQRSSAAEARQAADTIGNALQPGS